MERTLHKITIEVSENEWRRFKALAVERGESIQRLVGELVEREARAAERRQAQRLGRSKAAKRAMDKSLREIAERGA
jgi:replication fork clamp-binding protein CrfC